MPSLKVIACASVIAMLQFFNTSAQETDDIQVHEGTPEYEQPSPAQGDEQPMTLTPEQIQQYQQYLQAQQDNSSLNTFFPSWLLFLVFIAFVLGLGYFINNLLQIENDRERKRDEKRKKKESKKNTVVSPNKTKSK